MEAGDEYNGQVPRTDRKGKRIKVSYFKDVKDRILLGISAIFNALAGANIPFFLFIFTELADEFINPYSTGMTWKEWVAIMVASGILQFFLVYGGTVIAEISAERQLLKIRKRFLHEVMRQDISYFDGYDATVLAGRLTRNTQTVRDLIGIRSVLAYTYIGIAAASIFMAFRMNWKMALVCFCVIPVIILSGWWSSRVERNGRTKCTVADNRASSVALEAFSAIRTVKAYGLQETILKTFTRATGDAFSVSCNTAYITSCFQGLYWGLIFCASAFGFWYGAWSLARMIETKKCEANATCPTAGNIIGCFASTLLASYFIGKIIPWYGLRRMAKLAVRETVALYDRESLIDPYSDEGLQPRCDADIRVENVEFHYPTRPDVPVFGSLSFTIPAGKTTALVGSSGCGKSTVIQLIMKFYRPDNGRIVIGETDIDEINTKYLREQIAWVSQEPKLFAASIADNIRIGKPGASDDEVIAVAKQANAHEFVTGFPQGYDTWVGESGGQLSGGQKQRIAIARALIRNPKILILDEATSALDNKSEKMVQETLDRLINETTRTVIVIAHRLTTIRNADKIIVLEPSQGGAFLAEEGTHNELIQIPNGLYSTLAHLQMQAAAEGDEEDVEAEEMIKDADRSLSLRGSGRLGSFRSVQSAERDLMYRGSLLSRTESKLQETQGPAPKAVFRRSARPLLIEWYLHVLAAIGGAGYACLWPVYGMMMSNFMQVYVKTYDTQLMRSDAKKWTLVMAMMGLAAWVCYTFWCSLINRTGNQVTRYYREAAFKSTLRQEGGFFDLPHHNSGLLANIVTVDTWMIKVWVADTPVLYLAGLACILLGCITVMVANVKLGWVCVGLIFVLVPASWLGSALSKSGGKVPWLGKRVSARCEETMEGIVLDAILNIRSVTAYNMQEQMEERFDNVVSAEYRAGLFRAQISSLCCGLADCVRLLTIACLFYYGGKLLANDEIDGEKMVKGTATFILACFQVGRSFTSSVSTANGRASAKRILELIDREPRIIEDSNDGTLINRIEEVAFNHVAFKYPTRPDQLVYRDVSFKIPKGKVVALVGASGCGKSTAVQLIERFYDVYSPSNPMASVASTGAVSINGIDIRTANLASVRSRIGLVAQEPVLFWTTVEENIAYGNPGCSLEDIEQACRQANAWSFIQRLSEGLHTNVGRGGSRLSGGQKQRIAIARALVRKPDLLILDEATSALDAESERVVQEALTRLLETKAFTTMVIAHRLSTIRNADLIVVFQNFGARGSKIVEVGTHEELMQIQSGVYRGLVRISAG